MHTYYYLDYATFQFSDLDNIEKMAIRLGGYLESEGSALQSGAWYATTRYVFENKTQLQQFRKRLSSASTLYFD